MEIHVYVRVYFSFELIASTCTFQIANAFQKIYFKLEAYIISNLLYSFIIIIIKMMMLATTTTTTTTVKPANQPTPNPRENLLSLIKSPHKPTICSMTAVNNEAALI